MTDETYLHYWIDFFMTDETYLHYWLDFDEGFILNILSDNCL